MPGDPSRDRLEPSGRDEWRAWLAAHHTTSTGVWVVVDKQRPGPRGLVLAEAVEEALCVGWIDGGMRRLDRTRMLLWFCPRRSRSVWSAANKQRVARLTAEGRMTPSGTAVVEAAMADGSWAALDDVDALVVPADLQAALDASPAAGRGFAAMTASAKRSLLYWVTSARRPQTRARRVEEAVRRATEAGRPG